MSEESPVAQEATGLLLFWMRVSQWYHLHIDRHIPRLVWKGDELDVCVTFSQDKLNPDDPFGTFYNGTLYEIEKQFLSMGVGFDTGQGCGGRDWEWDWSLRGPISVTFRGRARHPERRREPPKADLRLVS